MKILMIAPTPFFADRGCHVRIMEQARSLTGRGHEVLICTYPIGRDVSGLQIRRSPRVPWYKKLSAGPSIHKPYIDLMLTLTTIKTARAWRPDIIHAHLHEGVAIGMWVRRFYKAPLLFDAQGSLTDELKSHGWLKEGSFKHRVIGGIEKRLNNTATAIVVSQSKTAEVFRDSFAVPLAKISVIEDAVEAADFFPRPAEPDLRAKLGIGPDDQVVAYLGLLTEYQGVDDLLRAGVDVIKERNGVKFLIMGYPNEKRYRDMAKSLGIADSVILTGRIDYLTDAPEYLALADIAVSPKKDSSEGNGKLFNYMAMGLPTVAYDTPVSREILANTGVLAPTGDVSALTRAILDLLDDRPRAAGLGARARERVLGHYSWTERITRLESIYTGLLEGNNSEADFAGTL